LADAVAAGRSSPRQFSPNGTGYKVVVSIQNDEWVVILEMNVKTGKGGRDGGCSWWIGRKQGSVYDLW
jgi:hypothetical protein